MSSYAKNQRCPEAIVETLRLADRPLNRFSIAERIPYNEETVANWLPPLVEQGKVDHVGYDPASKNATAKVYAVGEWSW